MHDNPTESVHHHPHQHVLVSLLDHCLAIAHPHSSLIHCS
jgi:hypothetical protein